VGYYQGWNVRERICDIVRPSNINTKGLTQLFYFFVFFDPTTFNIMPMNNADLPLYCEFTRLATNGLQIWTAIGSWIFSNPGVTHTAWSDMCATSEGHVPFIRSLIAFMDKYGFQGGDLNREYPENARRGGKPDDGDNLVLLVKEMGAAFGSHYGLSFTLVPDYWYFRGFRPAKIQRYLDFFGFMSYDLHGPWDTDVKALGEYIDAQPF
jgi:chitinase